VWSLHKRSENEYLLQIANTTWGARFGELWR
jgi:hypothetical protein